MQGAPAPLVSIACVCIGLQPATLTARQGSCTNVALFIEVGFVHKFAGLGEISAIWSSRCSVTRNPSLNRALDHLLFACDKCEVGYVVGHKLLRICGLSRGMASVVSQRYVNRINWLSETR